MQLGIFFFFFNLSILTLLGLCCCQGFSLVAMSRDFSLVLVHGLLIMVASLAPDRTSGHTSFRRCNTPAQWLQFPGSRAQAQ